ncbi:MAG: sigma-E processing peptidase SpoIIGA [Clostridia bacterium]|nr:sigma-E processing peptidase SpoIIGA [Clostridia bacterium]
MNYFILVSTAKFRRLNPKKARLVSGSIFGALCSLIILLPDMPFAVSWIMKSAVSLAIVLITFGYVNLRSLVKNTAVFFMISFCFCGFMLFVWFIFTPKGMVIRNSVVYFSISPVIMIITTVICYAVINVITRITERPPPKNEICKIRIINNNHFSEFYGKSDTGNTLCEPFSNAPVIVVNENALKDTAEKEFINLMYTKEPECMLKGKYRLIPFHSVGGSGLLPAFVPKEVYIDNVYCGMRIYVAVCRNTISEGEIKAMVNPEIIEAVKGDFDDSCKII